MTFDGLFNPIYGWCKSVRDPAAVYYDGWYYLFFTIQYEQHRWNAPEGYQIFTMKTRDFRDYTSPQPISPRGYVSPGSIIQANGRWYMSITRYPWPTALAMMESEDLEHWTEPRIVMSTEHGSYWGNMEHGPIDGYLFKWQERYYMTYSDYKAGTHAQHLGLAVSDDLQSFENLTPDHPLINSDAFDAHRGIENSSVVVDGDELYLFCSVGMPDQHIAVIKSNDLFNWPALDRQAEIRGLQQEWSKYIVGAQFVADWRQTMGCWIMLYMGCRHQDPYERMVFGMARSNDLLHWEALPEEIPEEEYEANVHAHRVRYGLDD